MIKSVMSSCIRSVFRSVVGNDDEFSIGSLWGNGEVGGWYDPSDMSTLFQDAAGTVPVAAHNDPVRLMRDKSGNGHHAVAPNDSSRPLFKSAGGLRWLEFDGVDDYFSIPTTTFGAASSSNTGVVGAEILSTGTQYLFGSGPGDKGFEILTLNGAIRPAADLGTGLLVFTGSTNTIGSAAIFSADYDRASSALRGWVNGSLEGTSSGTPGNKTAPSTSAIGAYSGGSALPAQIRLYQCVIIDRKLTDTERLNVETVCAGKSGVSL